MGNKKLRRQLAKLTGGRIYFGHKLAAYKCLDAWKLRRLINDASVKPGDVLHDCVGFNRRVMRVDKLWSDTSQFGGGSGWNRTREGAEYLHEMGIIFEGGFYRCPCSEAQPAVPRADSETWMLSWIRGHRASKTDWANGPYYDEVLRRLDAGEHYLDEDGCILPELQDLKNS